jgi:hypothetical protein
MDASFFPSERRLWTGRSFPAGGSRYVLTNLRLSGSGALFQKLQSRSPFGRAETKKGSRPRFELLTADIVDIHRTASTFERVFGLSTLAVFARGQANPVFLRRIRRGAQLAALLHLIANDQHAPVDESEASAILSWEPRSERHGFREAFLVLLAVFIGVLAVGTGLRGRAAGATFAPDDAIYPGGEKRNHDDIVRFMETSVMPWAREALAPIKGGADRITCNTCHGRSADARAWAMPAVAALPQPELVMRGWEVYSEKMDAQTRNAIYGYVAEADNQTKAAYMREVVMPGMARLLHRPPYDFTKPYDYNRTHAAFGCYHCHQVK